MVRGQQFELVAIAQYAATLYRRAVCRDLNFQKWGIRFSFDKVQNEFNFDFVDMYPKMTTMWYISFCNGLYGDASKHYCNGGFDSLYRPQRAGRINLGSRSAFDNLLDTSRRIISPVHHFLLGIENTDDTMMQYSDHVMEFKIRPRLMRVNILHPTPLDPLSQRPSHAENLSREDLLVVRRGSSIDKIREHCGAVIASHILSESLRAQNELLIWLNARNHDLLINTDGMIVDRFEALPDCPDVIRHTEPPKPQEPPHNNISIEDVD